MKTDHKGILRIDTGENDIPKVIFEPVNGTVWLRRTELPGLFGVTIQTVHACLEAILKESITDKQDTCKYDLYVSGEPIDTMLKGKGIIPQIIERTFRNTPLTEEQKAMDKLKSRIRCRVEHAFGFVTNSMNDFYIRSIGIRRAEGVIGLINLVYNMCRYEQIVRLNLLPVK